MAIQSGTMINDPTGQQLTVRVVGTDNGIERAIGLDFPSDRFVVRASALHLTASAGEVVVVTDEFSSVYGAGDDLESAVRDYLAALSDHVADLEDREADLAPGLARELASLRRYITFAA